MMQETTVAQPEPRVKRQRIGRRVGAKPYYRIAEQGPHGLVLASRPEINQPVARNFFIASGLLFIPTLLLIGGGVAIIPSAGLVGMLLIIPGLLIGTLTLASLTLGRALKRVINTIIVSREAQHIIFRQRLSARPPKSQTLFFNQIRALTLNTRMIKQFPAAARKPRPLVLLELQTIAGHNWIVDSAAEADALRPVATALADALGLPVTEGSATEEGEKS